MTACQTVYLGRPRQHKAPEGRAGNVRIGARGKSVAVTFADRMPAAENL